MLEHTYSWDLENSSQEEFARSVEVNRKEFIQGSSIEWHTSLVGNYLLGLEFAKASQLGNIGSLIMALGRW